ncbi:MAG: basic amino acid ABC transporter substrate-binding protein [candidate division Zixibacteria bacterium]|nr:basic amino acid ABC transporter substrate-binding protein [candidate division Zixibacteria bacterium]
MHMRSLMILVAAVCGVTGCTGSGGSGLASGVLRVGTDATYPPFETVDTETGEPVGFDIDLITEIAKLNGWKPEFIITPFDGMIPGLQGEKYDVAISSITITPERSAVVDFSTPYYTAGQIVAVPLNDTSISGIADLAGKRVGVQLGTTGEMMAQKTEGLEVFSYDNIGAAFIDMSNGNLDAVLNDFPTTQAYIRSHASARTVGEILSKEQYGIALRKGSEELRAKINQALESLKASGRYREIHLKWFDTEPALE